MCKIREKKIYFFKAVRTVRSAFAFITVPVMQYYPFCTYFILDAKMRPQFISVELV